MRLEGEIQNGENGELLFLMVMKTMKLQCIMTDSNDYHPETTKGSLEERAVIHT